MGEQAKVSFMAPKELVQQFSQAAEQDDRTVSAGLRRAMKLYIEQRRRTMAA